MMPNNVDVSSIAKAISEELIPQYKESVLRMYEELALATEDGKLNHNNRLTAEIEALRMYLEAFTVSLVQKVADEVRVSN